MLSRGKLDDRGAPDILRERCDFIYRRALPAALLTAAISLLLSAFLLPYRPTGLIVFWQVMVLIIATGFWGLAVAYRRAREADRHMKTWLRRAALAAAALGAGWGFAPAVFFPGGTEQQALIVFAAALVTAGGLPVFSTVWWIYALYAAGVMLPLNVVLFAYGTDSLRALGAAVPLLYLANVATAYHLGGVFANAYRLRSSYKRLAAENDETQAQLGEQLDSLLEAHREVQAYGRKLAVFSERAPIAVFEMDARATILDMNPAAENLFGYAAPELVGRNAITMLFGAGDREGTEKWWGEMIAEGRPATVVTERVLRRDGLELACEWTLTPLVDQQHRVTTVVLQGRDITQQRAAERVRAEFTSTLSHELRTPLTSINGSLQLLRAQVLGELSAEQEELVEIAERNGQRLLDLINEVLDIEKLESGRMTLTPEPIALAELVRESLQLNQGYADRFQVRLALAGEVPEATVRGDRKRLMQVMTNLLSNAAKFSPPHGAVEVSVALKEGSVRVAVADRGPGIPQAFRSRIFGRFAQADSADSRIKGGTGLGLAICRRLVEFMQGRVGYEDREGGGTVFFFELPVLKSEDALAANAVRVLLTEGDAVAAEYLAMVLEKAGYRVDMAHDASGSRALLGRWKYAAWLLSRTLEDAPDSLALVREMRPGLEETRILMLGSLRSERAGAAHTERHGIAGWLLKNDSRAHIVATVGQAIGLPAPRPST
jgi:PAS domain S-box-containing protein